MKKIILTAAAFAGFLVFANNASAQSATQVSSAKSVKEVKTEDKVPATQEEKVQMIQAKQKSEEQKRIDEYEAKIKANENNPNVDLTAAKAELARMKKEAGMTEEKATKKEDQK